MSAPSRLFFDKFLLAVVGTVLLCDLLPVAIAGRAGAFAWMVSTVFLWSFGLRAWYSLAQRAVKKKQPLTFLITFTIAAISVVTALFWQRLQFENGQAVQCAIDLWFTRTAGFHDVCLWGYPARQFLGEALPTLLFGHQPFSLNLGASVYLLCGLPIFANALQQSTPSRYADLLPAGTLALLPHFYTWNHTLLQHDQSQNPTAIGLLLVGALLEYRKKRDLPRASFLLLVLLHTASAYTPSLALLAGASVLLISERYFSKLRRKQRLMSLAIGVFAVLFLFGTLSFRSDLRMAHSKFGMAPLDNVPSKLFQPILGQLLSPTTSSFFSPLMQLLLLPTLLWALKGQLGGEYVGLAVWIILTFLVALFSGGVTWSNVADSVYRANVIAAPSLYLIFHMASQLLYRPSPRLRRTILALAVLACVFCLPVIYWETRRSRPEPRLAAAKFLTEQIAPRQSHNLPYRVLVSAAFTKAPAHPISDFLTYQLPNARIGVISTDCNSAPIDEKWDRTVYALIPVQGIDCVKEMQKRNATELGHLRDDNQDYVLFTFMESK